MNRIDKLLRNNKKNILSIYFTAGYPHLNDTESIIKELDDAGVDMIEIGMPFSDPVADGPVIQRSSEKALKNGMSLSHLFSKLEKIRTITDLPLIIMGYINPFFRFGIKKFIESCRETGIDGTIIPDLPVEEYLEKYETIYKQNDLQNIFLISPQTPDDRIRYLDSLSKGFLYLVSSSSTTGAKEGFNNSQITYFKKIKDMDLKTPCLTGFGISDKRSYNQACEYSSGAIIGSAFIKVLDKQGNRVENIKQFVDKLR